MDREEDEGEGDIITGLHGCCVAWLALAAVVIVLVIVL